MKLLLLLVVFLVLGVMIGILFYSYRNREFVVEVQEDAEGKYTVGKVTIDSTKGQIILTGRVAKTSGWVQFLLYVYGYKWLKQDSAIVSEVSLSDLQRAIALVDWKLWDTFQQHRGDKSDTFFQYRSFQFFLKWKNKLIPGNQLVLSDDSLELNDLVFLGSPFFDSFILKDTPRSLCRVCPVFPMEQAALKEMFVRQSGLSGYELNSEVVPPVGAKVTIILEYSKVGTGSPTEQNRSKGLVK